MRRKSQIKPSDSPKPLIKAMKYRVKDSSSDGRDLRHMSRSSNVVWNHCNAAQIHALRHNQKWPTEKDLQDSTRGSGKLLGISSQTVQAICEEYAARRRQFKKSKLRFRGRKSLGWVPFKGQTFVFDGATNSVVYCGRIFKLWKHRDLPDGAKIKCGSFSEDARGRWYCNVSVEYERTAQRTNEAVGIDLGLKHTATLSTGEAIDNTRLFARYEIELGAAQRANKSRRAQAINAKIANSRKDFLHKETTKIVNRFGFIAVGNVSGKWLQATNGKSSADAATGMTRSFLRYKAIARGAILADVSEYLSTQTCSDCDAVGGPKGTQGLEIREWKCSHCGSIHDRDVNAAKNILRVGLDTLFEGAPLKVKAVRSSSLQGGE